MHGRGERRPSFRAACLHRESEARQSRRAPRGGRVRILWTEDLRASFCGLRAKLRAKWDARFARWLPGAGENASPDSVAVVLFTSGSEGHAQGRRTQPPQHRDELAHSFRALSISAARTACFNAMPMFHSFGLTGGTILPLLYGIRTFHYPSPLHYRVSFRASSTTRTPRFVSAPTHSSNGWGEIRARL